MHCNEGMVERDHTQRSLVLDKASYWMPLIKSKPVQKSNLKVAISHIFPVYD
jgi:hypothetical protein